MKGYQAGITQFIDSDAVVFGISTDSLETSKEFAESLGLEFAVLSDEDGSVARSYGVLMDGPNMAKRATFVIDREGMVLGHVVGGGEENHARLEELVARGLAGSNAAESAAPTRRK